MARHRYNLDPIERKEMLERAHVGVLLVLGLGEEPAVAGAEEEPVAVALLPHRGAVRARGRERVAPGEVRERVRRRQLHLAGAASTPRLDCSNTTVRTYT